MKSPIIKKIAVTSLALALTFSALAADGRVSGNMTYASDNGDSENEKQELDMNDYRKRLSEIAKEQKEIEQQLEDAQDSIDKEEKRQLAISKKINNLNEQINITQNFINDLETQINEQQALVDETAAEIDQGVEDFKQRLRAMYLAGSDSYTDIIINSSDFFDVLMRTELVKRVADHDNQELDRLIELKKTYTKQKQELDDKQAEYKTQLDDLTSSKQELDDLYAQSEAALKASSELKEKLEEHNKLLNAEKADYADELSEILKDDYGDTADETRRMQTELLAITKLRELWSAQAESDGSKADKSTETEEDNGQAEETPVCLYDFGWPCPSTRVVTSGVGARWGTTHKGVDIGAAMGSEIVASEAGKVIIASNTCTHNVGKSASCGCGGGYGNYVVIDHGNGFITLYGHLTEATVKAGDTVAKGQKIGISGTTGWSTGPHLHFELRYAGNYMNPLSFVTY